MSDVSYLIDTSAVVRLLSSDAYDARWQQVLDNGLVALCDLTELEILLSARGRADREGVQEELRQLFGRTPIPDGVYQRAREVQRLLIDDGEHGSAGPVDLLVAATAELSGLTLLHHDRDFDAVARRTGQSTVWLGDPES
ncbi:PIN domain nuclease [Streptomyces sp. WI04-05B]|uniref:PIN domain nuclease n=1 Tax=Streptomyces TaxID=1883 RepID=UPI0029BA5A19|nr:MULTISPECIES: PIN domain nuclease [unclassified Streptomyces]MDX2548393.1 PIN domain nuclease [Streptomyces sp. WI04-05B]MDX2590329.1 PIN domain nuclease [Streptomyces sp. WI04-05A]MDX3751959.1 PIN domain nuclease [Streptomyces sp. AK08-02]